MTAGAVTGTESAAKADATLVAEFALAGIELVKMGDGTWLASRWGMFKPLATSDEARAWLRRVAGEARGT